MVAPTAPAPAPMKNPVRRPHFCIAIDSGLAASMEPTTMSEMGRVAKQGLDDNCCPTQPATTNIIAICEPSSACARTSTITLRLARASSWIRAVSVMAEVLDRFAHLGKSVMRRVDHMREGAMHAPRAEAHIGQGRSLGVAGGKEWCALGVQGCCVVKFM